MVYVTVLDRSCANGCKHCYCDSGSGDLERAKRIAFEAHENNYNVFFYPTMFTKECYEIQRMLVQEDQGLIARGDSFDPNDEQLKRYKDIDFSIHGATAEIHELFDAKKGSFDEIVRNIKAVRVNFPEMTIAVWTVVHKKNYFQLEDTVELCYQLGARYVYVAKLTYQGRARTLGPEWFLDRGEIAAVLDTLDVLNGSERYKGKIYAGPRPNWGMSDEEARQLRENGETSLKVIKLSDGPYCSAGRGVVTVDSLTGTIYPCQFFVADDRLVMGKWEDGKANVTYFPFENLKEKIGEPCRSCDLYDLCGGGCRAEAIGEHERVTGTFDPYVGMVNCRRYL